MPKSNAQHITCVLLSVPVRLTYQRNELYTSMKQKTMDHELMARLNRERQEAEKRRFEEANISIKRLENKRKVEHTGIIQH